MPADSSAIAPPNTHMGEANKSRSVMMSLAIRPGNVDDGGRGAELTGPSSSSAEEKATVGTGEAMVVVIVRSVPTAINDPRTVRCLTKNKKTVRPQSAIISGFQCSQAFSARGVTVQ